MALRFGEAKRREIRFLVAKGLKDEEVCAAMNCCQSYVTKLKRKRLPPPRQISLLRLSDTDREEIFGGLRAGESLRKIALRLGRAPSTISREVLYLGRDDYRPSRAELRAEAQCRRPKMRKLDGNAELARAVEDGLKQQWSPEQISKWLKEKHPENPAMNVSHETIYKALYVQGRGSLRKELAQHLRTGRTARRPRARKANGGGRIADMVNISQRPAEANDRAVPGHWEGDLIIGASNRSSIGTLVERHTRFVMLLHLPNGHSAEQVREALVLKIQQLPVHLRRSITWDQGAELAQHAQFSVDTGVKVYFCDPHSPWQRGSNENTNGLLRQYFPKGTDLSVFSASELDDVAARLNGRPRMTLNWRKPVEVLDAFLQQEAA